MRQVVQRTSRSFSEPFASADAAFDYAETPRARPFYTERWFEFAFVIFVLALGTYAATPLGLTAQSLLWYGAYAWFAVHLAVRHKFAIRIAIDGWPFLAFGALSLLSMLWSIHPGVTMRSATQMVVTLMMGVYIGARFSFPEILKMGCAILAGLMFVSVVGVFLGLGFAYGDFYGRQIPLGLFPHKNTFGQAAALSALFSIYAVSLPGWRNIGLAGVLISVIAVFISASTSSIVAVALLVGAGPTLYVLRSLPLARPAATLGIVLIAGVAVTGLLLTNTDPVDLFFELSGKSRTLTGRTDIWAVAFQHISDRPFLGYGFAAYWSDVSAGTLGSFVRDYQNTFNVTSYHNGILDLAVDLGVLGVGTMALLYWLLFLRGVKVALTYRSMIFSFPLAFVALTLLLMMVENPITRSHYIAPMLFPMLYIITGRILQKGTEFDDPNRGYGEEEDYFWDEADDFGPTGR